MHGWPRPTDGFLFLSLRLWFQKLKTTRPRKDKSLSVCFRKSKPNKIHVGGFWRVLFICLSGISLQALFLCIYPSLPLSFFLSFSFLSLYLSLPLRLLCDFPHLLGSLPQTLAFTLVSYPYRSPSQKCLKQKALLLLPTLSPEQYLAQEGASKYLGVWA